jgi:hypothetical protein
MKVGSAVRVWFGIGGRLAMSSGVPLSSNIRDEQLWQQYVISPGCAQQRRPTSEILERIKGEIVV